jgi:thiamine biosynthesis lipoprotein
MFGKKRLKVLTFSATSLALLVLTSCKSKYEFIEGEAQGTTYHIVYGVGDELISKTEVDLVLKEFDASLSTYDAKSFISQLNESVNGLEVPSEDRFFKRCFQLSSEMFELSEGAFDPTLFPIMKAYGFMKADYVIPFDVQIDSIMSFVGFGKGLLTFQAKSNFISKSDQRVKLDFNAIAQGISVDVLAELFESKGVEDYFIEIGGELRVKGKNPEGKAWRIGVDLPVEENDGSGEREIGALLELEEGAIATSGNYRKFFEQDGQKVNHTMDPKSGKPVISNVLSSTVLSDDAGSADALATALMVMGLDKARQNAQNLQAKGHYFVIIYLDEKGEMQQYWSPGMKRRCS